MDSKNVIQSRADLISNIVFDTKKKFILMSIIIFTFAIKNLAFAAEIPVEPSENIYVADYAAMIDDSTKNQILTIGKELDERYKVQIIVVTVDNLGGTNIEEYADELLKNWKIGDILLLIAKNERRFRIEVGGEFKDTISGGYATEVLDRMTNYFRRGDYSGGILQAYGELTRKIYEENGGEVPENIPEPTTLEEETPPDVMFVMVVGVILILVFYFFIKYIIALPLAISMFLVSAVMYLVTHGKHGTLNFGEIYFSITESINFRGGKSSGNKKAKKRGGSR